MTAERAKQLEFLGFFLAKFVDPATTDAEAAGAVQALVTRLRKHHAAGERDFVLMVVSREEARLVLDWRHDMEPEHAAPASSSSSHVNEKPAAPPDPFYDMVSGLFEHGVKEATKAGAAAVTSKIPGLVDELFNSKSRKARTGGT